MGIVLPDGNLNNPSLSWLRRWTEGEARLLAVVSLPEETFRSAEATVKASLVFLRRFTESDSPRGRMPGNRPMRNTTRLSTPNGPAFVRNRPTDCDGGYAALATILQELDAVGLRRQLPEWKQAEPPPYPRGVGMTTVGKPRWTGEASDKKRSP